MKKVKIDLNTRSYYVHIGCGLLAEIGKTLSCMGFSKFAYIITNRRVKRLYGEGLSRSLAAAGFKVKFDTIPDSEKSKSSRIWLKVVEGIAGFDKGRGAFVIALGGGVIGDLSGFAASTYRRGVPLIQVPTTLLAQVDSAIGGKTAIDTHFAKNAIGTFCQPRMVLSDVSTLKSLPAGEIQNGLAEIIKYAVILDEKLFLYLEKNMSKALGLNTACMEYLVSQCSRLKAMVVCADEQEKLGYRSILNFGHTLGHAIEAAAGYRRSISHGKAVAVGMLAAFNIAAALKYTDAKTAERAGLLIARAGLPAKIKGVSASRVLKAISYDKKIISGKRRWILPVRIGHAAVCHSLPYDIIKRAVMERIGS